MARCFCRWRNVLLCLCTPCILLALLFVYVGMMVTLSMTVNTTGMSRHTTYKAHFTAPGTYRNEGFAPLPKTFWDLHSRRDALWNYLQLAIDRYYNPILRPNRTKRGYKTMDISYESLLQQNSSRAENWEAFAKLPMQMQKFVSHMHKRDYPILIQPNVSCGAGAEEEEEPPLLLLAIKTTEQNFENREAIRQSWGQVGWVAGKRRDSGGGGQGESVVRKDGGYIRRVFLLGKNNHQEQQVEMSESLQLENKLYGDILQWDFEDSFFNLTLKDVLFWSWFSRLCPQARFVFKGDDDIFVNIPAMIDYLQDRLRKPNTHNTLRDFMVGDVIHAALPIRKSKSKYFVPESFYKGIYPAYAGGGGVVYSGILAKRLNLISKTVHLFPIDDAYVGMCMARLKAYPIHNPAFLTFDFPDKEEKEPCAYHTILLVHKRSPSQVVNLWMRLKETQTECLNVTLRIKSVKHSKPKIALRPILTRLDLTL